MKEYPVEKPSSAPATGRMLYEFVMKNLKIPSSVSHTLWYEGEKAKLKEPSKYAFRGLNKGWINLKTISGNTIKENEFAKKENDGTYYCMINEYKLPIFVSDLTDKSRKELEIPKHANPREKVFNPNFKKYDLLDKFTKYSSELASLSVPKSISSYFAGLKGKVNYSEKDVDEFLDTSLRDLSSPEMAHMLHGTHIAWCSLAYMRDEGNMAGDILNEFYGQNPEDFYIKDIGSILPTIFYMSALLGEKDADKLVKKIDTEIWGAKESAHNIMSKTHNIEKIL
ncbi:hypothetical protein K9L97_00250 [Candidatus Woesearchaeota archaeon]|nr:hypothetical protein [Candidatus Woesearchaeota archaeon]